MHSLPRTGTPAAHVLAAYKQCLTEECGTLTTVELEQVPADVHPTVRKLFPAAQQLMDVGGASDPARAWGRRYLSAQLVEVRLALAGDSASTKQTGL